MQRQLGSRVFSVAIPLWVFCLYMLRDHILGLMDEVAWGVGLLILVASLILIVVLAVNTERFSNWLLTKTGLMGFFYRESYLDGYWIYEYEKDGKRSFGYWRIQQDLKGTRIRGRGLESDGNYRSKVTSIGEPITSDEQFLSQFTGAFPRTSQGFLTQTILNVPRSMGPLGVNVPKTMDGTTTRFSKFGEELHQNLKFEKYSQVNSDEAIEAIVREKIAKESPA